MNKKVILGFGFGYESVRMLRWLKRNKVKFEVVVCLGEQDNVDPEVAKWFCKLVKVKCQIIKEGFKEIATLDGNDWSYKRYENTILRHVKDVVLISGRRFSDYRDRFHYPIPEDALAKRPVMDNVVFPFWEGKGVRFNDREKKLIGM